MPAFDPAARKHFKALASNPEPLGHRILAAVVFVAIVAILICL